MANGLSEPLIVPPVDVVARLEEASDDVLAGCIFDSEPSSRLNLADAFLKNHLAEALSDVVGDACIVAAFELIASPSGKLLVIILIAFLVVLATHREV